MTDWKTNTESTTPSSEWQTETQTAGGSGAAPAPLPASAEVNLRGSLREVTEQWAKTHLIVVLAYPHEGDDNSMVIARSGTMNETKQMLEQALANFDTLTEPRDDDEE